MPELDLSGDLRQTVKKLKGWVIEDAELIPSRETPSLRLRICHLAAATRVDLFFQPVVTLAVQGKQVTAIVGLLLKPRDVVEPIQKGGKDDG